MCSDTHPIRSARFHPAGDHLLVATTHAALHLYDVATFRCFLSPVEAEHHAGNITDVAWSSCGGHYASCAGAEVKLWDATTSRCAATLPRPHGGAAVGSVCFGADAHTLLTSGADSAVKRWDARMIREECGGGAGGGAGEGARATPVITYEGGNTSLKCSACFSHDGELVIGTDESTCSALVWHAATGELLSRCSSHSRPVRGVANSPTSPVFITCSDDGYARSWMGVAR